jgi:putative endonuclease
LSSKDYKTGQIGEEIVTNYLKSRGFLIILKNFKIERIGEIDIIALKDGILHFVEVKSSENVKIGDEKHSLRHFDKNKRERMKCVMQRYCFTNNITIPRCVDIAAVNVSRGTYKAEIEYYSNVYMDTI